MSYPVKIKVAPTTLAAWREDEYASFEDHDGAADHVYALLGRHATLVEARDEAELTRLTASAYNASACWDDRHAYRAAVGRIAQRLQVAK
jgi:hypothetical protein